MFQFLHHQHAGAFGHDKSVSLLVERTGSPRGFVIPICQRPARAQGRHDDRVNGGVRTAGKHHIRITLDNQVRRLGNRCAGAITACRRGRTLSLQSKVHRDLATTRPGKNRDAHVRTHRVDPAFLVHLVLARGELPAGVGGAHRHPNALPILFLQCQSRVLQCHVRRRQPELREPIHTPDILAADPVFGTKIAYLTRNLPGTVGFHQDGGAIHAGFPRQDIRPKSLGSNPDRGQ